MDIIITFPIKENIEKLMKGSVFNGFFKDRNMVVNMNCDCKNKNSSIKCTVQACKYNMGTENYCSLDSISVGTHEANPTKPECVDCNSFVKR